MKIAIVTWFNAPNYGTFLQAFALQKFLQANGYDADIVNFKPKTFLFSDIRKICFSVFPFLQNKYRFAASKLLFEKCSRRYMHLSRRVTLKTTRKLNTEYDFFISGSDQIWNPHGAYKSFYLLDFYTGSRCMSYASSLGGEELNDDDKKLYKKLLQKYSYISVREEVSERLLSDLLHRKVDCTVDPVFLLQKQDWLAVCRPVKTEERFIFCYFLGCRKFYAKRLEEIHTRYPGVQIIQVKLGNETGPDKPFVTDITGIDPFQFIYLIHNALLVCTDSFHATVFSLIMKNRFLHFLRFDRNDGSRQNQRVYGLLSKLNSDKYIIENDTSVMPDITEFDAVSAGLLSDEIGFSKRKLLATINDSTLL